MASRSNDNSTLPAGWAFEYGVIDTRTYPDTVARAQFPSQPHIRHQTSPSPPFAQGTDRSGHFPTHNQAPGMYSAQSPFNPHGGSYHHAPSTQPHPLLAAPTHHFAPPGVAIVPSGDSTVQTDSLLAASFGANYMDNWVELAQKLPEQDRRTKAPLIRQVKDLDKRIHPLEELERALWADLGMLGPVDSGDLFKLYQSRARADPSPIGLPFSHLQNLDTLHYLREDKSRLLRDILLTLGPALVKYNKVHTKQTVSSQNYSSQAKLGNRIWAVLIGINKYSSPDAGLYNLKGSAADAKRFQTYLTSKLSVPNSHIKLLVNGEPSFLHRFTDDIIAPTRVNILHELWNLRDDHCIQRGDVVVIFYSGHGAKYDARDYFTCIDGAGVIEAICPSDRGSRRGAHGVVPDISDRELNTILGAIRDAKGDNILFIADCCHAGGMTRAPVDMRQRGLRPLLPASLGDMLQEADNDRRRPAYTRPVSQPGWIADMSSHVLIAACENFEQALEVSAEERGIFTSALVQALESPLGMDPRTTFKSLIESGVRPMLHNIQIPTVVGDRKKCLLWFRD